MARSHRAEAKNLWRVLFTFRKSIWCAVLPFCSLNCALMLLVDVLAMYDIDIAFSPKGHGLMSLLVTFLVVSKVTTCYDRYMSARRAIGNALSTLRELNQTSLLFTRKMKAQAQWRHEGAEKIIDLMDCTIRVIKDEEQAGFLARRDNISNSTDDDPMIYVQDLRFHLYKLEDKLELLERMKLQDALNSYVVFYRELIILASTSIPFPWLQMARTFLFIWTFTIPLVLRGVTQEIWSATAFVFFLTYGLIGLELVSMKMLDPFGDGENDLNVTGMKEATINGIEHDMKMFGEDVSFRDKRLQYRREKPRLPKAISGVYDDRNITMSGTEVELEAPHETAKYMYHAMDHDAGSS